MTRARLIAVLAILLAGAVGIISSTQTWLVATLAAGSAQEIPVPGASAVPVLAALSLAVLALGLALSIVGTVLRYVFAVLTVAIGAILAILTGEAAFTRPVSAVAGTVTAQTGIAGADAVSGILGGIAPSPWPFLALAGWVLLIAAGGFTLVTARRWSGTGRRYRTDAARRAAPETGPLDAVDSWDDLSRGADPTSGADPR